MPLDQIANFVRGSAAASVAAADTTISVTDASTFPDPTSGRGEYNVVIWDVNNHPRPDQDPDAEVIRVTGRDTTNDDLTVTRGQEGTTGASHPSGSAIHLAYTQKFADDIVAGFIEDANKTVDTSNLADDAVDSTAIAAGAVVQAAIANGAVTVDELADALGTTSTNKIPGTTYFKNANVETLEATNQPSAIAELSADKTGLTQGNWENIVDTEVSDIGDLFDATNNQITPAETARYSIEAYCVIGGAAGSLPQLRLQNVTDGVTILQKRVGIDGNGFATVDMQFSEELDSGKEYEMQARDDGNSFDILSSPNFTELEIQKKINQA